MMSAMMFIVASASLMAAMQEPVAPADYLKRPEYVGKPTLNVALPKRALMKSDIERWGDILLASPAQQEFIRLSYDQFVSNLNEFTREAIPSYLDESHVLAESSRAMDDAFVAGMKSLRRRSVQICRHIEAMEHDFIDAFEQILTEDQQARLDILRLEATRRRTFTYYISMRGVNVDLRQIWLSINRHTITSEVQHEVEKVLWNYEMQWTPLAVQLESDIWRKPLEIVPLAKSLEFGKIDEMTFDATYRRIQGRGVATGRRIIGAMEAALMQIVEIVSDDVASELTNRINESIYPEIYVDRESLHPLFEMLVADEELPVAGEVVASAYKNYNHRYDDICMRMKVACDEWGIAETRGDRGLRQARLEDVLEPMLEQRRQLAREAVIELTLLVGDRAMDKYRDVMRSVEGLRGVNAEASDGHLPVLQ